ncbi:SDR family NAD(P)-dependent oxidoreductase [Thermodesulfobacteriota bacterium]
MNKSIFDLSGKVALVTAGGGGLGQVFCEAMAEFGANVACADINKNGAQETVELIKKFGNQAIAIEADISQQEHIEHMVTQTISEMGSIDILFCNAGIPNSPVRLHEVTIEDWDKVMALNIRGTFLSMRAVLPHMLKQQKGSIIITGSASGLRASPPAHGYKNAAPYGTSKAALIGLTKWASVEYAQDGIRINLIAPGPHTNKSKRTDLRDYSDVEKNMSKYIAIGRPGDPSELKGLVVYLASDASSYVTGQVIAHTGGPVG